MVSLVTSSFAAASGQRITRGRAASAMPAWVTALPLWQWYAIPNTKLSSTESSPQAPGNSGPSARISSWCGATLRRRNSVYKIIAAGGHSDNMGNDGDELMLNTEVPAWFKFKQMSAISDMIQRTPVYKDLSRAALHTYYSTQYDNTNDRILMVSGGVSFDVVGRGGCPDAAADWPYLTPSRVFMGFDDVSRAWLAPGALPALPANTGAAHLVTFDPLTNDIFFNTDANGKLWRYSPGAPAWVAVGDWFLNGAYACSAVDPIRKRLLSVGDFGGVRGPELHSTLDATQVVQAFGGLGAGALTGLTGGLGAVYDEANDCFLISVNNSPIEVIRIDAGTLFVDKPAVTGAIAQRPNGIYNAFQYVPELRGVVIANAYSEDVKFMRTHL